MDKTDMFQKMRQDILNQYQDDGFFANETMIRDYLAVLQDEVANNTQWTPVVGNIQINSIRDIGGTFHWGKRLFLFPPIVSSIFFIIGIGIIPFALLLYLEYYAKIIPNPLDGFALIPDWIFWMNVFVSLIAGFLLWRRGIHFYTFDSSEQKLIQKNISFYEIHAVQILWKVGVFHSSSGGGKWNMRYEINLVLQDGNRITLGEETMIEPARAWANNIASFIGNIPVWEIGGEPQDLSKFKNRRGDSPVDSFINYT